MEVTGSNPVAPNHSFAPSVVDRSVEKEILKTAKGEVNTSFDIFFGVALPTMRKYNLGMAPAIFTIRMGPALKDAIGREADRVSLPMNEYIARVLANHLGRPELGAIPRKSLGRPRKDFAAAR